MQREINAAMRQPILDAMARFETRAFADRPDLVGAAPHTFRSVFEVRHFTDRLLSIQFTRTESTGTAFPEIVTTTYTYDFVASAPVTLADIVAGDWVDVKVTNVRNSTFDAEVVYERR